MSEIVWQDPPPAPRGGGRPFRHADFAEALRLAPGRWALFAEDSAPNVAFYIRKGTYADFRPAGSFDAVSRTNGKRGRAAIYVRYVGGAA